MTTLRRTALIAVLLALISASLSCVKGDGYAYLIVENTYPVAVTVRVTQLEPGVEVGAGPEDAVRSKSYGPILPVDRVRLTWPVRSGFDDSNYLIEVLSPAGEVIGSHVVSSENFYGSAFDVLEDGGLRFMRGEGTLGDDDLA